VPDLDGVLGIPQQALDAVVLQIRLHIGGDKQSACRGLVLPDHSDGRLESPPVVLQSTQSAMKLIHMVLIDARGHDQK
jgi:hypothetical protein